MRFTFYGMGLAGAKPTLMNEYPLIDKLPSERK